MLWVHDELLYNYFNSHSAWIDFRRQNLTSTDVSKGDPRAVRVKALSTIIVVKSVLSADQITVIILGMK